MKHAAQWILALVFASVTPGPGLSPPNLDDGWRQGHGSSVVVVVQCSRANERLDIEAQFPEDTPKHIIVRLVRDAISDVEGLVGHKCQIHFRGEGVLEL